MSYFLYIASGLFLVTCQTALIPRVTFVGHVYDLLLPWVICLAAFRPRHETLPVVIFMGTLMDNLSGGPFGLYLTSYVWVFIAVQLGATVVRAENPMVLVLAIMAAVAGQNALFYSALKTAGVEAYSAGDVARWVAEQIGWVLLTGPVMVLGARRANRSAARRLKQTNRRAPGT